ncbi:MAG: HAD-IC family P-type ATPase [Peptococcaceae bacterium]|nr:HAD-IC family P-type ATPase [Peptococcaceae bacterium]
MAVFAVGYLLLGGEVLLRAARNIIRGKAFDESFLMSVATIGAFVIGESAEAVGVMLFYQVGEFFEGLAVRKSRRTIASLLDIRPDFANLLMEGDLVKVAPDTIAVGDRIAVKPGERIPLDGVVTEGESMLDTSALTGESVPRRASVGDTVLSGCVNQSGVLMLRVTHAFRDSTASKIIDLVENAAAKKAPTENFITKFARYYTPVVVSLAAAIALIPPCILGGMWTDWIRRGLLFLVISCPCALVISIPLGFFGGIGSASKRGILVKGGNYLEALADLDLVVFDKTGTLTKGVFEVTSILPAEGYTAGDVLEAAATAEAFSNHPIALSILRAHGKPVDMEKLTDYNETAGMGVRVNAAGRAILAGNEKFMLLHAGIEGAALVPGAAIGVLAPGTQGSTPSQDASNSALVQSTGGSAPAPGMANGALVQSTQDGIPASGMANGTLAQGTVADRQSASTPVQGMANGVLAPGTQGSTPAPVTGADRQSAGTVVHVAADGRYLGCLTISDEVKPDSATAVASLKSRGVRKTVMLTGDAPGIAEAIARELRIDEVYAGLLPQQKVERVEILNGQKRQKGKLAFVGDGINDAPVLAMADVGVAMGGLGSDAAIEAADVVLMTDEPSKLAEAIDVARFTKRIVRQNIAFAIGVKCLFLLLGAMGVANMWEAVFADVGVAVLAILNAARVIRHS